VPDDFACPFEDIGAWLESSLEGLTSAARPLIEQWQEWDVMIHGEPTAEVAPYPGYPGPPPGWVTRQLPTGGIGPSSSFLPALTQTEWQWVALAALAALILLRPYF